VGDLVTKRGPQFGGKLLKFLEIVGFDNPGGEIINPFL
jgi:hypothetical protein